MTWPSSAGIKGNKSRAEYFKREYEAKPNFCLECELELPYKKKTFEIL